MNRKAKLPFDPKEFLSKVNGGQCMSDYRKDQIVYRQGDPADAVCYIHNGKVKKDRRLRGGQGSRSCNSGNWRFLRRGLFGRGDPASIDGLRSDEMRDRANIKGRHHSRDIDQHRRALEDLFKVFVVNCAIRNGDAHLKNFGIVYADVMGPAGLAPIYDVVSTQPYLPNVPMAFTLNGSTN
jgi:hypothetical protein